jgi:hypothetical protein
MNSNAIAKPRLIIRMKELLIVKLNNFILYGIIGLYHLSKINGKKSSNYQEFHHPLMGVGIPISLLN